MRQGIALAAGESVTHRSGYAQITVQHVRPGVYMTIVAAASTGARVDELTSGPWPTESKAREIAGKAYATFATGRTVPQVIADLEEATLAELHAAQRRTDRASKARVIELNRVLDRLTPAAQVVEETALVDAIRGRMTAAIPQQRTPAELSPLGQWKADFEAARVRDRAERAARKQVAA